MWTINMLMSTLAVVVRAYNEQYLAVTTASTPAPEFYPAPYNVSFLEGDLAVLSCSVHHLGTKTVVWRRFENSFPLTSGAMTVVADKRISVVHVTFKNQWDLLIKDVHPKDAGLYECQISSKDRTIRRVVTLNVEEAKIEYPEIRITETQYVEQGERVILQCNATGEKQAPDEMDWFRNGHKLSSLTTKGIHIKKQFSFPRKRFTSVLTIDRARMTDDGTYVCRSSNMQITSTKVIVLNAGTSLMKRRTEGEKDAASHKSDPLSSASVITVSLIVYATNIVLYCMCV